MEVITTGVRSFPARPKAPASGSSGGAVPELKAGPQSKAVPFQKFEADETFTRFCLSSFTKRHRRVGLSQFLLVDLLGINATTVPKFLILVRGILATPSSFGLSLHLAPESFQRTASDFQTVDKKSFWIEGLRLCVCSRTLRHRAGTRSNCSTPSVQVVRASLLKSGKRLGTVV